MFMNRVYVLMLVALVSACSSDGDERPEYLDSFSIKGLEVPPKLSKPDTRNELRIPKPSAKAMSAQQEREGVKGQVAPVFKGLELKSDQGFYWLQIDQDADSLWPLLKDFLAHEGIKVYRDEPLLGFVETEWVKEYESKNTGFISSWLSKLSPDALDKFRLRIERVANKKSSRVYVSHRGLEISLVDEGTKWQQRAPEPSLEREFLKRLVLFVGLSKAQADDMFSLYKPYQDRIRRLGETGANYEITGESEFVWRRLMHALDRLGVEISQQNKRTGTLEVLVGDLPKTLLVEKDELTESSWLMNLFSDDSSDVQASDGQVSIQLQLKASGNSSRLQLSLADGSAIGSGLAGDFRDSLVNLLK